MKQIFNKGQAIIQASVEIGVNCYAEVDDKEAEMLLKMYSFLIITPSAEGSIDLEKENNALKKELEALKKKPVSRKKK